MKAEGTFKMDELPEQWSRAKLLPYEIMTGEKNVWKALVEGNNKYSIEILFVGRNSGVKLHRHNENCVEWYIDVKRMDIEYCDKGNCHELINTSTCYWLVVLSIKFYE